MVKEYVTFTESKLGDRFLTVLLECVCCGQSHKTDIFKDRKEEWQQLRKPLCKRCARFHRKRDKAREKKEQTP